MRAGSCWRREFIVWYRDIHRGKCYGTAESPMTTAPKARHWAALPADDIINQRGRRHVVNTGITPSGEIHVGNMREVVTADAIHRVLAARGDESHLLYIADTYDPLRHVYPFLDPQRYRDEVGKPLSE